jgi:hypothetical protein
LNKIENEIDSEEDEINPDTFTISRLCVCGGLTEEVMDNNSADLDGVLVNVPSRWQKEKKKLLNKNAAARKKKYFNERCILELQRSVRFS